MLAHFYKFVKSVFVKICIADRSWKILGVWHKYSPTLKWLKNKYLYFLLTFTLPCDIIIILLNTTLHRGIAQLVEQRSPKPRVVSSILTTPAKKALALQVLFLVISAFFAVA